MGAKAILQHVISDPVYYSSVQYSPITGFAGFMDTDPLLLASEDGLRKASEHFLEKAKHHLADETIEVLVKDGDPAEAILKAAKELYADIIAIGSHSRKWLENIIMGSVTEKILHHAAIPIFIIPMREYH
jgi:nucleotide-binding universal stress UspA family protein